MNINFELYRIFYVVANTGNITKASNELHISQPAVTQTIKKLEDALGGDLFIRTKRGVVLTEEGKEFYKYIKQAIDFIDNAEHKFSELKNLDTGVIKIGISTTLVKQFLLPILEHFHKQYPKIKIEILTYMGVDLIPMLRNGIIDIVIMNLPFTTHKDIKITPCHEIHDIFVVNKDYMKLVGKTIKLEELNNYPLILQNRPSNTRVFLDDFTNKLGFLYKPNIELASFSLVVEFTKIGMGIGYGAKEYIKNELETKELYELKTVPSIPKRSVGYALKEGCIPSFATQKLIEMINKKSH